MGLRGHFGGCHSCRNSPCADQQGVEALPKGQPCGTGAPWPLHRPPDVPCVEAERIIYIAGTEGSEKESSVRKVFLPKTVSMARAEEKDRQQRTKEMLDSDYQDFGLVIATRMDVPMRSDRLLSCFVS